MGMLFTELDEPIDQASTLPLTQPRLVGGAWIFGARFGLRLTVDTAMPVLQLQHAASLAVSFAPLDVTIDDDSGGWHRHPPKEDRDPNDRVYDLVRPVRLYQVLSPGFAKARLYRMDGSNRVDDPTVTCNMNTALSEDFTAAHFAVGQDTATGQANSLSLRVQGRPTSPRLKLRMGPPDGEGEGLWQWLDCPGEQAAACDTTITAASWASALERALALWRQSGATPATPLVLTLEAWSDAPCTLTLTPSQFQLKGQIRLLLSDNAAGHSDEALRFGGAVHQCQSLTLPGPFEKASAVAVLLGITQTDTPTASALPPASGLGQQGFSLHAGNWVARPWEIQAPRFVGGLAVPWWPLEAASSLTLSLHAGQAGQVNDTPLAQASVSTDAPGAHWLVFRWDECQLQPGAYWLRLRATDGGGIWLGEPVEASNIVIQNRQRARLCLVAPLQPIAFELGTPNRATPRFQCSLDGQAMNLHPDEDNQPDHWVASLKINGEQQGLGLLTFCAADPMLVSIREVIVEVAML